MKGKKVGVARGGVQEIALLAELAQNGLTWTNGAGKDVNIVYLAYADLNQALRQKQIDAMSHELLKVWSDLRKTIVFVTHGIEESIYLADRWW